MIFIVAENKEVFAQVESSLLSWAVFLGIVGLGLKHWDRIEKLFNKGLQ